MRSDSKRPTSEGRYRGLAGEDTFLDFVRSFSSNRVSELAWCVLVVVFQASVLVEDRCGQDLGHSLQRPPQAQRQIMPRSAFLAAPSPVR